jgi:hypothetical protein
VPKEQHPNDKVLHRRPHTNIATMKEVAEVVKYYRDLLGLGLPLASSTLEVLTVAEPSDYHSGA